MLLVLPFRLLGGILRLTYYAAVILVMGALIFGPGNELGKFTSGVACACVQTRTTPSTHPSAIALRVFIDSLPPSG